MHFSHSTSPNHPTLSRPKLISLPRNLLNLLNTGHMTLMLFNPLHILHQRRILLFINPRLGGNERVRHEDIGAGDLRATEELATVGGRGELGVEEGEVRGVVVEEVEGVDFVGDAARHGLDEEGDGGGADVLLEER